MLQSMGSLRVGHQARRGPRLYPSAPPPSGSSGSLGPLRPCSDSSATPSFPSHSRGRLGNSRMPPQLEKTHVVPTSWHDEALAPYSVSREVPRSVLKCETVLGTFDATPKVPQHTGLTGGEHRGSLHHLTCAPSPLLIDPSPTPGPPRQPATAARRPQSRLGLTHLVTAPPRHCQHPALRALGQDGGPAEAHALQVHGIHHGVPAFRQVPHAQLQVAALAARKGGGRP